MSDWITTILSAISSFFTSLYTVNPSTGDVTAITANPLLMCVLIPVVGGIAAFAIRLVKRARK